MNPEEQGCRSYCHPEGCSPSSAAAAAGGYRWGLELVLQVEETMHWAQQVYRLKELGHCAESPTFPLLPFSDYNMVLLKTPTTISNN